MCTVLLPTGVNPIAVNKYIVSYIKALWRITESSEGSEQIKIIKHLYNCLLHVLWQCSLSFKSLLCTFQHTQPKFLVPTCLVVTHVHWRTLAKNSCAFSGYGLVLYTRTSLKTFFALSKAHKQTPPTHDHVTYTPREIWWHVLCETIKILGILSVCLSVPVQITRHCYRALISVALGTRLLLWTLWTDKELGQIMTADRQK